ncbi:hypothetical protein G8759_03585 [Spirosoma aureum]|uniref:Outer membrane beta-barrel protein n=1 Tax=Spirosoma aureum TaxID=2692134 RepID=A0A6G9AH23_9BACT|nr:hypothetical protein [Spirosoma aureum]QIP11772.1 hypothetical protein G8759_03585 [Spirosoma aureum]
MKIRLHIVGLIVCLILISDLANAQERRRSTDSTRTRRYGRLSGDSTRIRPRLPDSIRTRRWDYAIVVTAGGGLSYYSTHLGVPPGLEQARISRFGVPASLRVMWYPDHRLRVGIETGWTTMYSYRGEVLGERTHVYVSAVPVLLVFSMPLAWVRGFERNLVRRMAVTVGTGAYVNHSRMDYAGKVESNTLSLGWMAAASYTYPVGRRFRIAGELKWYDAVAVENAAFTAELQLVWRAFSW